MRSVVLMAIANIKKRKMQSLLIGVTFLVTTVLFFTSLGIIFSMQKPVEKMLDRLKVSHLTISIDKKIYDGDRVLNWWKHHRDVETVAEYPYYQTTNLPIYKNRELSAYFYLSERNIDNETIDILEFVEGVKKDTPDSGEIWINNSIAQASKIKVGDIISIPTPFGLKDMKVGAIIIDGVFSHGFNNPTRAWIGAGELPFYYPINSINSSFLGVRLRNVENVDKVWKEFTDYMGGGYNCIQYVYKTINSMYMLFLNVLSVIMLIFSGLLVTISVFIIYSSISSSILSEYRQIGILKSQGFTPLNIISIFLIQFSLTSVVFIPPGILIGLFSVNVILSLILKSVGAINLDVSLVGIALMSFISIIGIILITTFLSGLKAGSIKAGIAIKNGAPETKVSKNQIFRIDKLSLNLPFIIGLKNLLIQKRRSFIIGLGNALTVIVILTGINLVSSFTNATKHIEKWGIDSSDISINRSGKRFKIDHEDFMNKMENEQNIKIVIPTDFVLASTPNIDDKASRQLYGNIYDGNLDNLKIANIEGTSPQAENEISLDFSLANYYNKKCGDMIELILYGEKLNFKISGIYQSVINNGFSFKMQMKAIKKIIPIYMPQFYSVILKDNSSKTQYIEYLQKKYGEAITVQIPEEGIKKTFGAIIINIKLSFAFIIMMFLVVSFTTIFNTGMIDIQENKRNFGILKTIGFKPSELRFSQVFKTMSISLIGAILGVTLWINLFPIILNSIFISVGLKYFPIHMDYILTILTIPSITIFSGLSAWIPSGQILKINPKTLIVE